MLDLAKVKKHIRVLDNEDDDYITSLMDAATEYTTKITAVANDVDSPKSYELACSLLVSHWYDNRNAAVEGNMNKLPFGYGMLINSLKPGSYHV